jgi:hypothetical protein
MPKFVNKNAHPVRVSDGKRLRRLVPGQVVTAEGEFADNLQSTSGVDTAGSNHEKEWDAKRSRTTSSEAGPEALQMVDPGPAITALGKVAVSDPLQVVVGDDAAPRGPGTGTITTRDAVHESGDVLDKLAFERTGVAQARDEGATGQTAKRPERQVAAAADAAAKVEGQLPRGAKGSVREGRQESKDPKGADESKD